MITEPQQDETKAGRKSAEKQIEKKLKKLEQKLSEIDSKISKLQEARKEVKADISSCKDEQILCMVRSSNLSFQEISESIRLAISLHESEKETENSDESQTTEKSDTEPEPYSAERSAVGYKSSNYIGGSLND